jgi:hypothetical protein
MIQLLASIWSEQEPTIVYLKVNGLKYCKVTLILLIGFLEIVARGITTPTQLEVEFNTAAWGLLSTPIRQILEADNKRHRDITGIPFSQRRESAFEKLPLKFFNGARIHGVLPGRNWRKWSSNPLCGSGSWYYSEGTLSPILYCC